MTLSINPYWSVPDRATKLLNDRNWPTGFASIKRTPELSAHCPLKALQLMAVPVLERDDLAFADNLKLAKIGLARDVVEAGWHQPI